MIKLSEYAEQLGIAYQTAWRHYKAGKIPYPTKQLHTGTVLVDYQADKPLKSISFQASVPKQKATDPRMVASLMLT